MKRKNIMKRTVFTVLSALAVLSACALPAAASSYALPGDVNRDGKIDTTDARMILQGDLTAEQAALGDVNHDGKTDASDAILILKYDVGKIDSLNK